jgi:uncharacterized membrane protein
VAELLGLIVALVMLTFALLPILTFLRLGRLSRELEDLTGRVRQLETARAASPPLQQAGVEPEPTRQAHPPQAVPSLTPVPHPTPDAPETPAAPLYGAPEHSTAPIAPVAPVAPGSVDLESRIGGRGLLYTGVVVILLGTSFFLKYAFDNAWINETGRVMLGALSGVALVAGGLRLARGGLAAFGQALAGTGFAILYLAIYAALSFYQLIGVGAAFAGMVLVTIGAALTADRERAQALALIAVVGGFITPFLVGGGENAQLTLFTYDALLVTGTLVLALRHDWFGLNAASYVLTVLTVSVWAVEYYARSEWLRTLLFLTLFCVQFLIVLRFTIRAPGLVARLVSILLMSGPVLYHIAAVIIAANHPPAIHIYLIAFTSVGLWLTAEPHRPFIRLLVLVAGFAPLFGALTLPNGLSWTLPNVVTIVALGLLHMLAILDRAVRQQEALAPSELLAMHLTGLGLFALLYETLQPAYPDFRGGLAAILALGAIGLWQWLASRERVAALNAAALAFTLAALGVAVQFDGPSVVIGWAAEGAAAVWLGLRAPSIAFQFGGLVLWAFAALRLFEGYFGTPANFTALFNLRSVTTWFVIVLGYAIAWMFNRSSAPTAGRTRASVHVAASFITIVWITAEIHSYWELRRESSQADLYEQVMLSLAWGLYGALLIALGMRRAYPPVRYVGMTILAVTVVKVFFYDLWELGGIYRVVGFIGFGILLVLVSYLYQKRRVPEAVAPPPLPEQPPPAA